MTNRLSENQPLPNELSLGRSDTMKIVMTAKDGNSEKMPHQAFLLLKDTDTGLDYSYPFSVKDSGKSKVELVRPGSYQTAKLLGANQSTDAEGPSVPIPLRSESSRCQLCDWVIWILSGV